MASKRPHQWTIGDFLVPALVVVFSQLCYGFTVPLLAVSRDYWANGTAQIGGSAPSLVDAVRAGATWLAGGSGPVVVVIRPANASLTWVPRGVADPSPVWESALALSQSDGSASTLYVDAQGAVVDCGLWSLPWTLRVGNGTLVLVNVTVQGCSAQLSATYGDVSLLRVDADAACALHDGNLQDFVGSHLQFASVAGVLNMTSVFVKRFNPLDVAAVLADYNGASYGAWTAVRVAGVKSLSGGLLLARGNARVDVSHCDFRNVSAATAGGIVSVGGTAQATVADTNATDVFALNGALAAAGGSAVLQVSRCMLVRTSSTFDGGAFYCGGTSLCWVRDTYSAYSTSSGSGGLALFIDSARGIFERLDVFAATVANNGGVMRIQGSSSVSIDGSHFSQCGADGYGGIFNMLHFVSVLITNTVFQSLFAGNGGFSFSDNYASTILRNCTVAGTRASLYGGVTVILAASLIHFENVLLHDLRAGVSGGLAYMSGNPTVSVVNSTVLRSRALKDGGVFFLTSAANAIVDGSSFTEVSAAGNGGVALIEAQSVARMTATNVTNATSSYGGAFMLRGGAMVSVSLSAFAGSRAQVAGGVAYARELTSVRLTGVRINLAVAGNTSQLHADALGAKDPHFNSAADANGGAVFLGDAASLLLQSSTATGCEAEGSGGFLAAVGPSVSAVVTDATVSLSRASVGGAVALALGAKGTFVSVRFDVAGAESDGGCVYAGQSASLNLTDATMKNCFGGVSRSTFGAGGAVYISLGARDVRLVRTTIYNVSAVLGPGVYLAGAQHSALSMDAASSVSGLLPIAEHELPADWRGGNLVASAVSRLTSTTDVFAVESGVGLRAFAVALIDAYGSRVSVSSDKSLAVRLRADFSSNPQCSASCRLVGDLEKNFATSSSVSFTSVRVFAPPGSYQLHLDSASPFLYGDLDPDADRRALLGRFSLTVNITECAHTELLTIVAIDSDPERMAWQCVECSPPCIHGRCMPGYYCLCDSADWLGADCGTPRVVDACDDHRTRGAMLLRVHGAVGAFPGGIAVIVAFAVLFAAEVVAVPLFKRRFLQVVRKSSARSNAVLRTARWNAANVVRLAVVVMQALQIHAIVLDVDFSAAGVVSSGGRLFSFASATAFSGSFYWYFWLIMSLTLLWIFYAGVYIADGGASLRKWRAGVVLLIPADEFLQVWVTAGFIPSLLNGLRAFGCWYIPSALGLQAFMASEGVCDVSCWTGQHWAYVVVAFVTVLTYYPLATVSAPLWQDLQPQLDVRHAPQHFFVEPLIAVVLVLMRTFFRTVPLTYLGIIAGVCLATAAYHAVVAPCYVSWVNVPSALSFASAALTALLILAAIAADVPHVAWGAPAVWLLFLAGAAVYLFRYPHPLLERSHKSDSGARRMLMALKNVFSPQGRVSLTGIKDEDLFAHSVVSLASLRAKQVDPAHLLQIVSTAASIGTVEASVPRLLRRALDGQMRWPYAIFAGSDSEDAFARAVAEVFLERTADGCEDVLMAPGADVIVLSHGAVDCASGDGYVPDAHPPGADLSLPGTVNNHSEGLSL